MSISKNIVDGKEELIIRNQPQITEKTLDALIQFMDNVDIAFLQEVLNQMYALSKLYASEDFFFTENEEKMLLFTQITLRKLRHHQSGDTIS